MVLYRPGAITAAQLTAATGVAVKVFEPASQPVSEPQSLPSPGVGIRHYAPHAGLLLIDPVLEEDLTHSLLRQSSLELDAGHRVGLMLPDGWAALPSSQVFAWGSWTDPTALAHNLFTGLRDLDQRGVGVILCPLPPTGGLYDAIRDRLRKAALPA